MDKLSADPFKITLKEFYNNDLYDDNERRELREQVLKRHLGFLAKHFDNESGKNWIAISKSPDNIVAMGNEEGVDMESLIKEKNLKEKAEEIGYPIFIFTRSQINDKMIT